MNTFYKKVEIKSYPLVKSLGKDITYEISPTLPPGMIFINNNCTIIGTPSQNLSLTEYNITVISNEYKTLLKIGIEVKILYCQKDGRWLKTELGNKAVLKCTGTKSGNQYRNCELTENNQVKWTSTIDNCNVSTYLVVLSVILTLLFSVIISFLMIICFIKHHPIKPIN